MIATYNGKVVVNSSSTSSGPWTIQRTQDQVDSYIANDTRWTQVLEDGRGGVAIQQLVFDDGEPITEWIEYTDVPGSADSSIVLEPAFYFRQNG